jgi:plastocyanin
MTIRRSLHAALLAGALIVTGACSRTQSPPAQEQAKAPAAPEKTPEKPPVYFSVDPATAGVLTGKVRFTGKRPPKKTVDMDEDPTCQQLHHTPVSDNAVEVNRNGTLANVFIYVKTGLEGKTFKPPSTPAVMDQKGCWFVPRVLGIQTGQELEVTNSDPLTHNIHPRAHINREWNHSQAQGAAPLERKFTQREIMIRVKCNIHGWMHAWIGVVDNPYFAVTGSDGTFSLKNLPPGAYTIEAWQEALGSQEQQVTIGPSGKSNISFSFKGE